MPLTIAIDFDDTLTADPVLWSSFVSHAKARGHKIICVTARRETEENIDTIDEWMEMHGIDIPVYFTNLASKVSWAMIKDVKVDIWVDNNPHACVNGY